MGYRILNVPAEVREAHVERHGLEGPFFYGGRTVLYYDPRCGQYWDPHTDHYLTYDAYNALMEIVNPAARTA